MDIGFRWEAASSDEEAEVAERPAESPWDFTSYTESAAAAAEHERRNTTSIDDKIFRSRHERPVSLPSAEDEDEVEPAGEVVDADEPAVKENRKSQDIEVETSGEGTKAFFASPEGVSFHVNSFMELNLSRPLLRACEVLGYHKPTPIQIRMCPIWRQTMLFSATMTEEVDKLVKLSLAKPIRLQSDPSTKRPAALTEEVVRIRCIREANLEAILLTLCSKTFTRKVIIFSGTKQAAHRLKIIFGLAGMKAAELHGNLTQVQRLDALELFKRQEVDFLIATDVAARGLDIVGVQTVINFACPRDVTRMHRWLSLCTMR